MESKLSETLIEVAARAPSGAAARTLEILLEDKERGEGDLDPERVDSLLEKRSLDAEERVWVYSQLGMQDRVAAVTDVSANTDEDDTEEGPAIGTEDPVAHVLRTTASYKLLTAEDERRLGRIIQNGEVLRANVEDTGMPPSRTVEAAILRAQEAERKMALANLRLVVSIANQYGAQTGLDRADLFQEGIVGLLRAIRKFNPELGYKFSTYATWWIHQSIHRAIDDKSKAVRIPVHMSEKIRALRKARSRLGAVRGGGSVNVHELAERLGWSEDETTRIWAYAQVTYRSLDQSYPDEDGGEPMYVIASSGPTPDLVVEELETLDIVNCVLDTLSSREADIIRRRFGIGNVAGYEETLEKIGEDYGVTRERIRQIEEKALRKLRHPNRVRKLKSLRIGVPPDGEGDPS